MIVGVDRYKDGWVAAIGGSDKGTRIELFASFEDLLAREDLELIVIDVPIGLLDQGRRQCDVLARKLFGPRRNSIFTAPIRPMLAAATWEEACEIRERIEGKRCSKQVFGILSKIRELDTRVTPELQGRVREGHPEVSFAALRGEPLEHYKGTPEGRALRLELLLRVFPDLRERIQKFAVPNALTDVLDAYTLLWTARRIQRGTAVSVPEKPECDGRGLRAEIVW